MSKYRVFGDERRTRDVYKRVATADGNGVELQPDGKEEYTFEVSLDLDSVYRMAFRAAANKTGVAKRGGLTVKITNRRKV